MNYGQFLLNLPNHIHCCILFHVRSTNVKWPDLANRKAGHIDAEFIYKKKRVHIQVLRTVVTCILLLTSRFRCLGL